MVKINYKTIQLPEDFIEKYVDCLVQDKTSGYKSRASVVKAGIRHLHGFNPKSDHHKLLLFLIKTFFDSDFCVEFPDDLENEIMNIYEKEIK